MFPLPLFSTVPDNLETMDSRYALRFQNTFMKNTIIRGLNKVFEVAPMIGPNHSSFQSFLVYAKAVCDMLQLQMDGDQIFFTTRDTRGWALDQTLGKDCNPKGRKTRETVHLIEQTLFNWSNNPTTYRPQTLQAHLQTLEGTLLAEMSKQVDSIQATKLLKIVPEEKLRGMIKEHVAWLASHSDITILLPFVVSHHDPRTSAHWPLLTKEGWAALPDLVAAHQKCWDFAPLYPIVQRPPIRPF